MTNVKNTEQRINNIIGQLDGIKKMLANNRSCADILTQFKASHSALGVIIGNFVEENILKQIDKICAKDKKQLRKLISELTK